MATLDEKFLDGPNVGYCSDSDEDEGTALAGFTSSTKSDGQKNSCSPTGRAGPSTGPKAVLADYQLYQEQLSVKQRKSELELLKEAKRFTLENPSANKDDSQDEDELEKIRRRRMEQLKNFSRGRIVEIPDSEEFLSVIETNKNGSIIFIHIYRDGLDACNALNEALLELAPRFKGSKFFKVQAHLLGTSGFFTANALPVLQAYLNGELTGNFVRVTDSLGEDFSAEELAKFLISEMLHQRFLHQTIKFLGTILSHLTNETGCSELCPTGTPSLRHFFHI